ncbi:MAG: tRNA (N6-threonylcarbamoyladenosine(37)-N6)-methyltransferase TrmO [Bacteroidota bacterium]
MINISSLTVEPIGYIRTPFTERYTAPRQPGADAGESTGKIVLLPGHNFQQALEDLAGFEMIWIISWFHRNDGWKPKVLPPRGGRKKRGVFATRSPHRPNPIGLSLVRLVGIRGRIIDVGATDLIDGTPVIDIKPYIPTIDAFPDARAGWLEDVIVMEHEISEGGALFAVAWSPLALEQAAWLRDNYQIDLADLATSVLRRNAAPHPYRRITQLPEGALQLAIKSWRIIFTELDGAVTVERIASGYSPAAMADAGAGELHDHAAHIEFHNRWPA